MYVCMNEIMHHILKVQQIFLLLKYIKLICRIVFLVALTYSNKGHLKVTYPPEATVNS